MVTLRGHKALQMLATLHEQLLRGHLCVQECNVDRQEVESCYGGTDRPHYATRIHLACRLLMSTGVPAAHTEVFYRFQQVLTAAVRGHVRNVCVRMDPVTAGTRLLLSCDDETSIAAALCA